MSRVPAQLNFASIMRVPIKARSSITCMFRLLTVRFCTTRIIHKYEPCSTCLALGCRVRSAPSATDDNLAENFESNSFDVKGVKHSAEANKAYVDLG